MSQSEKQLAPRIEFATRLIESEVSTFDSYSTILRLEDLLEEAKNLQIILQPILNERWAPAFFEFVEYYKVGFVTCLEWHAKARTFDLFSFCPTAITGNDIKRGLSSELISQMVSQNLTVPHLLASSFSVSSLEQYVKMLDRVLSVIGSPNSVSSFLKGPSLFGQTKGKVLNGLYEDRNSLVHEISLQTIGHRNIRQFSEFEEVIQIGTSVLELIKEIELEITKYGPNQFPNLLSEECEPICPIEGLRAEIAEIENSISERSDGKGFDCGFDAEEWLSLVEGARSQTDAELEFIDSLDLAGWQYFDVRPKLQREFLEQRLSYLRLLKENIGWHGVAK